MNLLWRPAANQKTVTKCIDVDVNRELLVFEADFII